MTLEDELPGLFDELAGDHTVGAPPALRTGEATSPPPRSWRSPVLVGIAAACVALLVGGLVVVAKRDAHTGVAGQPPTSPLSAVITTLPEVAPTTASSAAPESTPSSPTPVLDAQIAEALGVDSVQMPSWFETRTNARSCGTWVGETASAEPNDQVPLDCFSNAVANDERAQVVTVHAGDDLRVARWIVTLGAGPVEAEQFEVAALVVDDRDGTTRWFETRCVEGNFVDGRLVGDHLVARDQLDQLDPSGTSVTDDGQILDLPGPQDRGQLQPCNGPVVVERPFVTPVEATGRRIGDQGSAVARFPGLNEAGEYDLTVTTSWTPVGANDPVRVIGFARTDTLDALPPPPASPNTPTLIYADDGITRIGQFGPDGRPALDD